MNRIAPRIISCAVWHQTRPSNALLHFTDPAAYHGRYNRQGGPGVWYASLTERGAWAELSRHWDANEVSPFEVRRRVGRARVERLAVLDLTDANVRHALEVTYDELTGDDVTRCQQLAEDARAAGFDGVLAPSGALAGETTLAVFASAMIKVTAQHSRVQRPPVRMVDVLTRIRVPEPAIDTVGRLYQALAALSRRLRRSGRG